MDRNDEDSWLEQVCILNEQSLGIGDTRYHHIGTRYELLHAVGYFPVDIVERRVAAAHGAFGMVFISFESDCNPPVAICGQ